MPFALLQTRLAIPDVEALRRAFRGVGGMSPMDAPGVARDGFGILVRQLSAEDASALQASLAREGVATEMVDERMLPRVPPLKLIRRVSYRLDAFVGFDPYDRELVIPWDRIVIASVGNIESKGNSLKTPPNPSSPGGFVLLGNVLPTDMLGLGDQAREARPPASSAPGSLWVADFILVGGDMRFTLNAHQLTIVGLGERDLGDPLVNFFTFLRDSLLQLPGALLNRAAYALREEHLDRLLDGHPECPRYPTRNAYQEELIWLLWRLRQAAG